METEIPAAGNYVCISIFILEEASSQVEVIRNNLRPMLSPVHNGIVS